MIVNPFWFGVFSTLSFEAIVLIVLALTIGRRK